MVTLKEGQGEKVVKNGDTVSVNYEGRLEDGSVFDSSYIFRLCYRKSSVFAKEQQKYWEKLSDFPFDSV